MTHAERDKVYTAFLIRHGLDKKYELQLDPAKGTCRLGERIDGKFVRCMKQHDGSRCPLKDKYDINILSVDLVENGVVTGGHDSADDGEEAGTSRHVQNKATQAAGVTTTGAGPHVEPMNPPAAEVQTQIPLNQGSCSNGVADLLQPPPVRHQPITACDALYLVATVVVFLGALISIVSPGLQPAVA